MAVSRFKTSWRGLIFPLGIIVAFVTVVAMCNAAFMRRKLGHQHGFRPVRAASYAISQTLFQAGLCEADYERNRT
jgi:hypothetical protein